MTRDAFEGMEAIELARSHSLRSPSKRKRFDWLGDPSLNNITPFQRFILDINWNRSPLGPIESWPTQLKHMVLLIVQDPSPAVIYWGEDDINVYNEAYAELIGKKHPALQGQDPKIQLAEVWDHFEKVLSSQRETAETVVNANVFLLLHRYGFYEETYFSWKFVPIIGEGGFVVGSYATVVEVTAEVVRERRMTVARSLSERISAAPNIKELWSRMIRVIEDAQKDIPLSLLYSIDDPAFGSKISGSPPNAGIRSRLLSEENIPVSCVLEGTTGIPPGHAVAATSLGSEDRGSWLTPMIRKAAKERAPIIASVDGEISKLLHGIEWLGHGIPSTQLVLCPIIPSETDKLLAFLVVFLNPRRPYDEDYRNWLRLLTLEVTTPQLSAILLREEVDRRQSLDKQAVLDRERLFRDLTESETKFARFADRAPIGLAILGSDGTALSANDLWRDLTQLEVGTNRVDWASVLTEDQVEPMEKLWDKMLQERRSLTIQTRIRRAWQAPELDVNGHTQWGDTELLLVLHPDFDDNGEILTITSCITDISDLKWTERQLRKKIDQGNEMRRQQERFIDMTSHEMRNPLSALMCCADEIVAALNEYRRIIITNADPSHTLSRSSPAESLHLISDAIEAADIIIYCAMHQKRIVDDILMLSRLDSNLLQFSPEPCRPISLIRASLKMFDAEIKRASIHMRIIEEPSLQSLNVSWTLLDPSRLLQVLINLMTNAVKFTRTETTREIIITIGASLTKPSEKNTFGVQYVSKANSSPDQTSKANWGDGETLYLSITVEDTGKGLNEHEIKNLFHLFTQASPKTHQTYGGSGLGLFISRQLVEMQGGEIGVASQAGKGSIFQFYVKTRRTTAPIEEENGKGARNADFQMLLRQDALREACAVENPAPQAAATRSEVNDNKKAPLSPTFHTENTDNVFHILVVEDNLVNQRVVTKQLRKAGHVVDVANHGQEALDFLRRSEFWNDHVDVSMSEVKIVDNESGGGEAVRGGKRPLSVLLMDLEMPVMDGIECVKKIRVLQDEGKITGHVPILAVTANARKDQIMMSLEAGMDDVIMKPYRIKDMLL